MDSLVNLFKSFFKIFIGVFILIGCLLVNLGINTIQYGILHIPIDADESVALTAVNHDDFTILSREYSKFNNSLNPLVNPYTIITYHFKNENVLRSLENDVYIIDKKDDANFPDVPKYKLDEGQHTWAIKNCKNNGIGCDVNATVKYKFGEKDSNWPKLMQLRYSVRLTVTR